MFFFRRGGGVPLRKFGAHIGSPDDMFGPGLILDFRCRRGEGGRAPLDPPPGSTVVNLRGGVGETLVLNTFHHLISPFLSGCMRLQISQYN